MKKNKKNNFCVYLLTFPNKKVYVGQTCQKPNARWACGHGYDKQPVGYAIKKFGWKNIRHDVICSGLTHDEADELEKAFISLYNSMDIDCGYNFLPGGVVNRSGFKNTAEQNRKISESHKKEVVQYSRDGVPIRSYESVTDAANSIGGAFRVISAVCNGKKKTAYGFVWRFSGDSFDKYDSSSNIGGVKGTPVAAFFDNGELSAMFKSAKHAEKMLGIDHGGILRCCHGITPEYKGYIWRFCEENNSGAGTEDDDDE